MPYDPNQPQNGQPLDADALRLQLQGLFEAITGIPKGDQGDPGEPGPPGQNGSDGGEGPPGPPFAQAVVDSVNTIDAGQDAGVSVSFDGTDVHFTFDIPRGADGPSGNDGSPGNDGPPGEVSLQQMKDSTSANTNGVSTLDDAFMNDPPTLGDLELLRSKLNELILALRQN